ncbi:response regulator [Vallitalea pronyensis]|uniref:Stage 0 sporulation protein A homolog n=1 Tax=Vallitalea pronyensis TaxID=1348613 RepID=A0A8J8SGI3_9FIRM|nr:response regulator [Vallitalea pronyensis]QUI22631.1 response regulator [Vallitalea pronyensis]
MFSLLVVEDEKWIRKGIIHKLKKSDMLFDHMFEAKDGNEALDILNKEKIDIIITDICMPDMDGIELIKRVKAHKPHIECIIISGYSEFKYAEAAINMGVKSYLLKPTTDEDLQEALYKVINLINEKRQYHDLSRENVNMKIYHEKLLYEKELNRLLKVHEAAQSDILGTYYPYILHKDYQLLIINIHYRYGADAESDFEDMEDIKSNIMNDFVVNVQDDNYYAFNNVDVVNQIFILVWGDKKQVQLVSDKISKRCFYGCLHKLHISATIGISSVLNHINESLYKSAKKALDLRLIYGQNKIYWEEQTLSNAFVFPKEELKLLKKNIERRYMKNVDILLADIFSKERFKQSGAGNLYFVYSEVINAIYEMLYSADVNVEKMIEYDLFHDDIMNHAAQLEDVSAHLFKFIQKRLKVKKKVSIDCKALVEQAVNYIDSHFEEKINVKSLSDHFGITANYFSTIFKKELGVTCTQYLTTKRLNYACRMLKETDINVEEVAKGVGYEDLQYFYRVFKKEYHVTPVAYRKGNIKLSE